MGDDRAIPVSSCIYSKDCPQFLLDAPRCQSPVGLLRSPIRLQKFKNVAVPDERVETTLTRDTPVFEYDQSDHQSPAENFMSQFRRS
jgi:hypothetical protein